MESAAIIAAALIGVVAVFQVALAAGAPWGRAAWGGRNQGVLPGRLRLASALSVVLLVFMAWVVLANAGLVMSPVPSSWLGPLNWLIAGYFALGAVINLISPSPLERMWSPVSAVIAVCAGVVAAA